LKGGDPFVFGRGGEEAQALRAAGCDYEVVPGITAGVAAPGYAGIPVTQRGMASAVAFVTGHEDPAKPETAIDWAALAAFPGTLVFYMGVRQLPRIAEQLVAHGRDPSEPAAIVERGTLPEQRVLLTTVAALGTQDAHAPAVTVVGPVAALHDELAWLGRGPLADVSVAVTRARAQASGLAARLGELGADVLEAPAITLEELPFQAPDLGAYEIVCLTSANGVERLLAGDVRALAGVTVAAVGSATAAALRRRGIEPDVLPQQAVQESLLEALGDVAGRRVLIATAEGARDVLAAGLRERGAEVDELALYRTVREPVDAGLVRSADLVTFTSSSTVTNVLDAMDGHDLSGLRAVSIGPVTSGTLRERGVEPVAEADPHDVDGLVAAVLAVAAG